jgi:hypothetical protein
MNVNDMILGEDDPAKIRRTLREGHSISTNTKSMMKCRCGWRIFTSPLLTKEDIEQLAWLHITKPSLIIADSSDVEGEARRHRARHM